MLFRSDAYLAAAEADRLPVARGLVPTRRELLIRELILCLKRGWLDTARLTARYGIDPLEEWAANWQSLEKEGFVESIRPRLRLSRAGLLQIDSLLPRFFDAG